VVVTDIQSAAGQGAAKSSTVSSCKHDVTVESQWNAVVDSIGARYGALHILINNAALEGQFEHASIEGTTLEDWQKVQRVNVEGVFLGCRAAIPLIKRSGGGAIINLSSMAALAPTPEYVAYGASKAAVRHLTESVAAHCAQDRSRIRCNSIHPGVILTPMIYRILDDLAKKNRSSREEELEKFRQMTPQGEFSGVEDVAAAVAFLVSEEARRITGLAMTV